MDHAAIGSREGALETLCREKLDHARHRRRDLRPVKGARSPYRPGADRIEAETNVAPADIGISLLDEFDKMDRRHA